MNVGEKSIAELEDIISAYQYVFGGRQGELVLEDLRERCAFDQPICSDPLPSDRELLHRAAWHDIYGYIQAMITTGERK